MSMVGTFDGFTAARLGIYAAQHGLRTTGNNVSNINTPGYTRQRVDQMSFKAGANDMYRSAYDNHVGSGALVTGINQIRDPYLDIRYRTTSTDTYHYDTWLAGLQGIASVLDEVGKGNNYGDGLIYAQLQDLADKLRAYGNNPTDLNERLVRNSASSLTGLFHTAANGLQVQYNETVTAFKANIDQVNEILTSIRDLNKSIREAEVHGDSALEMRDERNRQIDALSQYLDIKVEYSYEDIGGGIQVEKLTISLNNANPDNSVHSDEATLVDGVFATQLSVPKEKPVLNATYPDNSQYWYLKGYTYSKAVSNGPELDQFLADHDLMFDDLIVAGEDKNGNALYLIGANDPDLDGIVTEPNDNFTIQLGKLLNAKGEEWKTSTTAWLEVPASEAAANTRFSFTINGENLKENDSFSINGVTYTLNAQGQAVGSDGTTSDSLFDANNVVDSVKLAQFVADHLDPAKYPGYTISSKNGRIVFTPDPANPPTSPPNLSVSDPDNLGTITVGDRMSLPDKEYDEHGNVTKSTSYVEVDGKWYQLTVGYEYTHEVTLDDNDLHGILQAQREMLTEEGEFSSAKDLAIDENALIKRGIPYYQKSLDLLAQKFAEAYNQLNHGYAYNQDGNYINENGEVLTVDEVDENGNITSGTPLSAVNGLTSGQIRYLVNNNDDLGYIRSDGNGHFVDKNGNLLKDKNGNALTKDTITADDYDKLVVDMDKLLGKVEDGGLGGWEMGGMLFSNRGDNSDPTGINASNISVSADWSNGAVEVIRTFEMLFADDGSGGLTNSTQPSNINHMIAMIENSLTYDPRDLYNSDAIGPVLFHGSFNDMLSNMMAVEAMDADITGTRLDTSATQLTEIDYSRDGVSGVDLNDEAMDMITYQKAMTAAMRVMTVIDSLLDRLVNNTGIT